MTQTNNDADGTGQTETPKNRIHTAMYIVSYTSVYVGGWCLLISFVILVSIVFMGNILIPFDFFLDMVLFSIFLSIVGVIINSAFNLGVFSPTTKK